MIIEASGWEFLGNCPGARGLGFGKNYRTSIATTLLPLFLSLRLFVFLFLSQHLVKNTTVLSSSFVGSKDTHS